MNVRNGWFFARPISRALTRKPDAQPAAAWSRANIEFGERADPKAVNKVHSYVGLLNRLIRSLQQSQRFATPAAPRKLTVQTMASKGGMEKFRNAYASREMRIQPVNDDELKQMRLEDGMLNLECASLDELIQIGSVNKPPTSRD